MREPCVTLESPETARCNIANHGVELLNKQIRTNAGFDNLIVQSCFRVNTRAETKLWSSIIFPIIFLITE